MNNFWKNLNKPVMVLAPMANVTDAAFRTIIAKYGCPDVFWTEFVSAEGLMSEGRERILPDLWFSESQRPIVAQIFGTDPVAFEGAAVLLAKLGFDGIDINMGCPEKNICRSGAGAALVNNSELAKKLIKATQAGAPNLPVSVKIRLGDKVNILEEWLPELLSADPAVVSIHFRTRKEMSKVPAHWEEMRKAVTIRDDLNSKSLIIGNGDVMDLKDAEEKIKRFGGDGVMIGRGIFGNPWLFNRERDYASISLEEKIAVMIEHTFLFEKMFKDLKNFDIMKKHYKAYIAGFDGAKEMRMEFMTAKNAEEVAQTALKHFPGLNIETIKTRVT